MLAGSVWTALAVAAVMASSSPAADDFGPPPPGQARVFCPEAKFDWGTVFTGQEVTHKYIVENRGTAELRILHVRESCRCTKKDYTEVIPPGGRGHVTLAIDTQGFKGRVDKSATIETNDPTTKEVTLLFGGSVRELVKLSPLFPTLRGIMGGEVATATVTLKPASDVPLTGLKLISVSSRLKARVEEVENSSEYRIHLETVPGLTVANVQETVQLEATANELTVQVGFKATITLRHRVEVKPQWVIFRYTDTDLLLKDPPQVPARTLQVTGVEGNAFTVTKVETEGGFFTAALREAPEGGIYEVVISATAPPAEGPAQPARGKVQIHTTDPVDKVLTVSVMGFFKQ